MRTALVITNSGIGNALSSLQLIEALARLSFTIDVAVNPLRSAAPVFEEHPDVSGVLMGVPSATGGYDHVFYCSYDVRNIRPETLDPSTHVIPPFMARPDDVRFRFKRHEIEYFLDMARDVGWAGGVPKPKLSRHKPPFDVPPRSIALSVGYWKGDDHSHRKHWGNDNFIALSHMLLKRDYHPLFIGSKGDWEADARHIAAELPEATFAYEQTLLEGFGALAACCGYVGNETCMVPAAGALRKPALSLVMKEAEPHLICPQKNYPYPHGTALLGSRGDITPGLVSNYIVSMIEQGPLHARVIEI